MQNWEYEWDTQDCGVDFQKAMRAFGDKGWELISVVPSVAKPNAYCFFYKRPKR
jgi:hypothetical protein